MERRCCYVLRKTPALRKCRFILGVLYVGKRCQPRRERVGRWLGHINVVRILDMNFKRFVVSVVTSLGVLMSCASPPAMGRPDPENLGPAPLDSDGRFTNPGGDSSHGSFGARFPFIFRRIGGMFRDRPGAPIRIEDGAARLRAYAHDGGATVTWVGHSTLLVEMNDVKFLTDPIWSETASPISFVGPRRFSPPGIALDELPAIDFVVISHNHYDHMDLTTIEALAERSPDTKFWVPLGNAELLRKNGIENVGELDWGESAQYRGLTIHCLPARHWSKRGIGDDRKALWSSWAVEGPEKRFFFSGDSGYFDGFSRIREALGTFDLAAVPIGAYEPSEMMRGSHMNPEEAVLAAVDLGAGKALAIHFGTFDLSDESLDEPPRRFLEAAAKSPLNSDAAWVLQIGETRAF
jgi:N-acyl-phosphatidylethanolamine-hydrolysing phospholipase D